MTKKFYIAFLLAATFISCSKQKIIPEKTLVNIIYEMHIVDAVLSSRESPGLYRDSMKIYEPVVEKFGYSLDDLHRTLLKYTTRDGKLQSVLDSVIRKIASEQNIYRPAARIEKLSENMNVGADSISIVSKTVNKHSTEIILSEHGVYDISASYFFYKNDSTKNPRMSAWLESRTYKDSIMDKQEKNLAKDTVFNNCSVSLKYNDPAFNILKIYWLDCDIETVPAKQEPAPQTPANRRTAGTGKKPNTKIKPDTVTRQHYIIAKMSVKYNFEKSDTTGLIEQNGFIGPVLPDFDEKEN
jgi:hypothetical protein